MFPVYDGKCLSHKAVHIWVEKFSQGRSKVADDARPDAEVAETTVKRLMCCVFRSTGKAMRQVYHYWWRICQRNNFSPSFHNHVFRVLYPLSVVYSRNALVQDGSVAMATPSCVISKL
jgi:hypothetical protein